MSKWLNPVNIAYIQTKAEVLLEAASKGMTNAHDQLGLKMVITAVAAHLQDELRHGRKHMPPEAFLTRLEELRQKRLETAEDTGKTNTEFNILRDAFDMAINIFRKQLPKDSGPPPALG